MQSYPTMRYNYGLEGTRLKLMTEEGFWRTSLKLLIFVGVSLPLVAQDKSTHAAMKSRSLSAQFVRQCLATGTQFPGITG